MSEPSLGPGRVSGLAWTNLNINKVLGLGSLRRALSLRILLVRPARITTVEGSVYYLPGTTLVPPPWVHLLYTRYHAASYDAASGRLLLAVGLTIFG